MKIIKALLEKLLKLEIMGMRQALADEGAGAGDPPAQPDGGVQDPAPNTPPAQPNIDFESLIAKARKEEKEKLYPEITKLKEEVEKKVTRINELLLAIGEKDEIISQKDKEIKELKTNSKKSDSQEVKDLKIKITELENKLAEKDKEISTIKLTSYRDKKIAEAGGELIPELVTGNSEEEIDLSIEKAKERYREIVSKIASQQSTKPLSSNNIPPANPNTSAFTSSQVSTQSLNGLNLMTPEGRAEYEKMRKQMGLK
jgi:hypothetical protein